MRVLRHNSLWCVCGFAEPRGVCAAAGGVAAAVALGRTCARPCKLAHGGSSPCTACPEACRVDPESCWWSTRGQSTAGTMYCSLCMHLILFCAQQSHGHWVAKLCLCHACCHCSAVITTASLLHGRFASSNVRLWLCLNFKMVLWAQFHQQRLTNCLCANKQLSCLHGPW